MKRKRRVLILVTTVVAVVSGVFLISLPISSKQPMTVAFVGFTNALPFQGAPEDLLNTQAVFHITNHTAMQSSYYCEAHGSQINTERTTKAIASRDVPGYGADTFMVPIGLNETNGWTFMVLTSVTRPRPAWQQRFREYSKNYIRPLFFNGPAKTYPQIKNSWTTP